MCVICVLCLIVVRLPPGRNPFAVKINSNNNNHIIKINSEREQLNPLLQKKKKKLIKGNYQILPPRAL
jgi:uncharacterized protein YpmS